MNKSLQWNEFTSLATYESDNYGIQAINMLIHIYRKIIVVSQIQSSTNTDLIH
jgi:hypothetical protein